MPQGDLRRFTVGIEQILEVAGITMSLCPLDNEGYPCAPPSELMALPFEVNYEMKEFFELMAMYMSDIRQSIAVERKWKVQQERAKYG